MNLKFAFAAGVILAVSTTNIAAFAQEYAVPKSAHLGVNLEGALDSVQVSVAVTLRDSPVKNLTKEDFVVLEDDIPREVLEVSTKQPTINTAIILDCSASMYTQQEILKSAVRSFIVADSARPQDRFAVICAADHNQQFLLSPLTSDRAQIWNGINDYLAWGGTYLAEAIDRGIKYIQGQNINDLSQIIIFSDGHDEKSQMELAQTMALTSKAKTMINVVGLNSELTTAKDIKYLRALAEQTGGVYVPTTSDGLEGALKAMITRYLQRYVVSFHLIAPLKTSAHRLHIEVRGHPEYTVSYQRTLVHSSSIAKSDIPPLPLLRNKDIAGQEPNGAAYCSYPAWAWELGVNVKLTYKGPNLHLSGNQVRYWSSVPDENATFAFSDPRILVGTCYIENQSQVPVNLETGSVLYINGSRGETVSDRQGFRPYEIEVVKLARENFDHSEEIDPDFTLRCQLSDRNMPYNRIRFTEILPLFRPYFNIDISQRVYFPQSECRGSAGGAGEHD